MTQKPIKIDLNDGKLKQFSVNDDLPNQPDVEELKLALGELVFTLIEMGIRIENPKILKFLKYVN